MCASCPPGTEDVTAAEDTLWGVSAVMQQHQQQRAVPHPTVRRLVPAASRPSETI